MVDMLSVQEAAVAFAKEMAAMINAAAAETVGIEVMWFRAKPDKRSQDVIFQSYTLFGVEDCPLTFKAVYSDTGYDDAAITYNIMGLEYSVPLTLEIATQTWYNATNSDGTLPQRGDIVYIPLSNKLVEVVSMTPVKAIGAQITSFKVNCSIYKPTRSRLVGENLKESIKENTENLFSRFGKDIDDTMKNIVDNDQLDMYNSTAMDKHKTVARINTDKSLVSDKIIRNIISKDLVFDGHIVARTYYDMELDISPIVSYTRKDTFEEQPERCYSCWVNIKDCDTYKNVKKLHTDVNDKNIPIGEYIYLDQYSGKKMDAGTPVVIERGNIVICGVVEDSPEYKIKVHPNIIRGLNKHLNNWTSLTGYIIRKDNIINLLYATNENDEHFEINIKANNYIAFNFNGNDVLIQLSTKLRPNKWYGLILNFGEHVSVDVFEGSPEIKQVCSISPISIKYKLSNTYKYQINSSNSYLTNIRLYDCYNNELDKQITDLVSYSTPYNSHAIINDSVDTPLNKEYIAEQR